MRAALVLLLSLALAACGDHAYRVGILSRQAVFEGADLAAREINTKNGIDGTPLRAVKADTGGRSRADSTRLMDKLAADTTVKAILFQSGQGVPADVQRVFFARGIPVLVLGPILDRPEGNGIFHLMPAASDEAKLMASQAARLWQPKRAAIVRSPDRYGSVLSAQLRSLLPGTPVVLDTVYEDRQDTAAVAALERTITASRPDVLFWLGTPRVLHVMLVRLRQHLPNLPIMGSEALEAKRVYENPDGIYTGVVFVRLTDPTGDTVRLNNFQYQYSLWMGGQASSEAMLAYDATGLVAQALRSGARSRQQLRDYIASLGRTRPPYQGLTGPISFDPTGVLRRPLGLAEVREDGVKAVPTQ